MPKKIEKGEIFTITNVKKGTCSRGEYCFLKINLKEGELSGKGKELKEEITLIPLNIFEDNIEIRESDKVKITDIHSVNKYKSKSKTTDKWYENVNVEVNLEKISSDIEFDFDEFPFEI